jgi:hypothetical protein
VPFNGDTGSLATKGIAMRVNVYNEELTSGIEVVKKTAEGKDYYGICFYLHSAKELHSDGDDDRSAVTLWRRTPEQLTELLSKALEKVKAYKPK